MHVGFEEAEPRLLAGQGGAGLLVSRQGVAEPLDGLGLGQQVLGDDQGADLGVELGDRAHRGRLGRAGRLELARRLVPLLGEIVRQRHDRLQGLQLLPALPAAGQ